MSLWMVRGDKFGQLQSIALEKGVAYLISEVGDVSDAKSLDAVLKLQRDVSPGKTEAQLRSWADQLFALAHRIEPEDIIAMPLRGSHNIAFGRVKSGYQYREDLGEIHHTVSVDWSWKDIPRSSFAQDLLYSFGSARTVCQIQRNDAEERVQQVLKGAKDVEKAGNGLGGDTPVPEDPVDMEQLARDQILGAWFRILGAAF